MTKLEQVAQVFTDFIDEKRAIHNEIFEGWRHGEVPFEMDEVQITQFSDENPRVEVVFDGGGHDSFSSSGGCEDPETGRWITIGADNQERWNEALKAIDPSLYIEEINSWSFGVWLPC